MKAIFAYTFYFIAQFNLHDKAHEKATQFTDSFQGHMVTTDWVIVELADAFAQPLNRTTFVAIYQRLQGKKELRIVPADRALLQEGFHLYAQRPDKEWSLTDCISFVVMRREGLTEALTGDDHFEHAGFVALLK